MAERTLAETDIKYVVDKNGKQFLFENSPVIAVSASKVQTDKLQQSTGIATPSDVFGDSGDCFSHMYWHGIFAILWTLEISGLVLIGLAGTVLLRGREFRKMHKGQCVRYEISLPEIGDDSRKPYEDIPKKVATYPLAINFPSKTFRVPAAALTLERFKCIIRKFIVPEMIKYDTTPSSM